MPPPLAAENALEALETAASVFDAVQALVTGTPVGAGEKELSDLARACTEMATPNLRLAIMGAAKAGKSTVVNALVGIDVSPSRDQPMTFAPTVITHSPHLRKPRLRVPAAPALTAALVSAAKMLTDGETSQLVDAELVGDGAHAVAMTLRVEAECGEDAALDWFKSLTDDNGCEMADDTDLTAALTRMHDSLRVVNACHQALSKDSTDLTAERRYALASFKAALDTMKKLETLPEVLVPFAGLGGTEISDKSDIKFSLVDCPGIDESNPELLELLKETVKEVASNCEGGVMVLNGKLLFTAEDTRQRAAFASAMEAMGVASELTFAVATHLDLTEWRESPDELVKRVSGFAPGRVFAVSARDARMATRVLAMVQPGNDSATGWEEVFGSQLDAVLEAQVKDFAVADMGPNRWRKTAPTLSRADWRECTQEMLSQSGLVKALESIIHLSREDAAATLIHSHGTRVEAIVRSLEERVQSELDQVREQASANKTEQERLAALAEQAQSAPAALRHCVDQLWAEEFSAILAEAKAMLQKLFEQYTLALGEKPLSFFAEANKPELLRRFEPIATGISNQEVKEGQNSIEIHGRDSRNRSTRHSAGKFCKSVYYEAIQEAVQEFRVWMKNRLHRLYEELLSNDSFETSLHLIDERIMLNLKGHNIEVPAVPLLAPLKQLVQDRAAIVYDVASQWDGGTWLVVGISSFLFPVIAAEGTMVAAAAGAAAAVGVPTGISAIADYNREQEFGDSFRDNHPVQVKFQRKAFTEGLSMLLANTEDIFQALDVTTRTVFEEVMQDTVNTLCAALDEFKRHVGTQLKACEASAAMHETVMQKHEALVARYAQARQSVAGVYTSGTAAPTSDELDFIREATSTPITLIALTAEPADEPIDAMVIYNKDSAMLVQTVPRSTLTSQELYRLASSNQNKHWRLIPKKLLDSDSGYGSAGSDGGWGDSVTRVIEMGLERALTVGGRAVDVGQTFTLAMSESTRQGLQNGAYELMPKSDGSGVMAIVRNTNGRKTIVENATLVPVQAQPDPTRVARGVATAVQVASVALAQYHMVEITERLQSLQKSVDGLITSVRDETMGAIIAMEEEFEQRFMCLASGGQDLGTERVALRRNLQEASKMYHTAKLALERFRGQIETLLKAGGNATPEQTGIDAPTVLHSFQVLVRSARLLACIELTERFHGWLPAGLAFVSASDATSTSVSANLTEKLEYITTLQPVFVNAQLAAKQSGKAAAKSWLGWGDKSRVATFDRFAEAMASASLLSPARSKRIEQAGSAASHLVDISHGEAHFARIDN